MAYNLNTVHQERSLCATHGQMNHIEPFRLLTCFRAIALDEKRYSNACRFMPERFFDISGKLTNDDPAEYVFGLGRRICPGGLSYIDVLFDN
jgi:hypothetical protein